MSNGLRKTLVFALVASIATLIAIIVGIVSHHAIEKSLERELDRTRDYCAAVSAALAMDARDFESGDPMRRTQAMLRFGETTTYHSEAEILLCAKTPPDLTRRDACWLAHDFSCLAQLARAASQATQSTKER